ncbi:hypothetical protein [Aurantibacillus circumpalustris]|uniref:hypothetical protein n=1 Tax=Aurantibacillus circumpalustris TaxID=3036359 RepID=UPI00295B83BB|nr:hypothetical protein [Aurantibacillus circumpalustris]
MSKHPLYLQAHEILKILDTLMDTADEEAKERYAPTLLESATIICAKLSSGLVSESYVQCMQNASLVREHAEYLRLSNHLLNHSKCFDPEYIRLFRAEMEKFRELFKIWASQIHKMEPAYENTEWGLFVKDSGNQG